MKVGHGCLSLLIILTYVGPNKLMKINKDPLIFHASFEVSSHTALKSEKTIRQKGSCRYIGSSSKVIGLKHQITAFLMQAARRAIYGGDLPYMTAISFPIRAQIKLIFPKSRLITKKDTLNQKCGDLSNMYQMTEDCLVKAGILTDDCWIKDHSGSEIMISSLDKYMIDISLFKINDFKYKVYRHE